jgi:hypothetical protein
VFEDRDITEQLAGARGRLDNPTTTLLGPSINPDGGAAGGATGRTVHAAVAGWSQVLVQNGARKLFDEMPISIWRSPSRVLEVTIHQVCYPMTDSVIRAVFAQYGKVEHIHVFGGLDPVLTHVVFETKHEAADAFGELHGRNIYDGCCRLDIQWCSFQDPRNTNLGFSCG